MQRTRKNELIVGVFSLIAIGTLFAITFIIKGNTGVNPYIFRSEFPNVAGLEIASPVLVQGLRAGRVVDMEPGQDENGEPTVIVTSKISRVIPVYKDAEVTLAQQGFLGDMRLEIDPGTAKTGEIEKYEMIESVPAFSITDVFGDTEGMIEDVKATIKGVRNIVTDEERIARIDSTLVQFEEASTRLNRLLEKHEGSIDRTVTNIEAISEDSRAVAEQAKQLASDVDRHIESIGEKADLTISEIQSSQQRIMVDVEAIIKNSKELTEKANNIASESEAQIKSITDEIESTSRSLRTLLDDLRAGEGTAGKLLTDPSLYNELNQAISKLNSLIGASSNSSDLYSLEYTNTTQKQEE